MGVILIAGVYGVGKSTLISDISKLTGIAAFSAGDLISLKNGEKYGVNKVVSDIDNNQTILANCVAEILRTEKRIVLAGHFCIVNQFGDIEKLSETSFCNLYIEKIILLETNVDTLVSHLKSRDGRDYPPGLLSTMLEVERTCANEVAMQLGCPLCIHEMQYTNNDAALIIHEI